MTLGLTMIVRDEARSIERCLASVAPFVDAITVCDTGSVDETPEIARNLGATVVHFPWENSFSAARNFSLEHSRTDWNLILDADEWLDASIDRQALYATLQAEPFVGLIRIRSEFHASGQCHHADAWLPRLLPKSVRYKGRIHEQPVHSLKQRRVGILVRHDGYAPEQVNRKRDRNQKLLKAEIHASPSDPYAHFQMGVHHAAAQQWHEALLEYRRSVEYGGMSQPFCHELAINLLHVQIHCGLLAEALRLAQEMETRWPQSSDVYFATGNLYLDLAVANPCEALDHWLPAAEAAWLTCLRIGERSQGDVHVLGRGGHLAAHNLAVIYEGMGKSDAAALYRGKASSLASQSPTSGLHSVS